MQLLQPLLPALWSCSHIAASTLELQPQPLPKLHVTPNSGLLQSDGYRNAASIKNCGVGIKAL